MATIVGVVTVVLALEVVCVIRNRPFRKIIGSIYC